MSLDGVVEGAPCLSPARVEAPALVAFAEEDVDEDAVAAADVDEAGEDWYRVCSSYIRLPFSNMEP